MTFSNAEYVQCWVMDTHAALAELHTWIKLNEYQNWAVRSCIEEELYSNLFQDLKMMEKSED